MKVIPYFTTPLLEDRVAQTIRKKFDSDLSWLEYSFPIVQTGIMESEEEEFTYPQVYANDGSTDYYDIRPDWDVKSYCFFEFNGAESIDEYDGKQYNFDVTFYARLDLIGYVQDTTTSLIKDVLNVLKSPLIEARNIGWTTDVDEIFDKYSDLHRIITQSLMRHGTAFKISFSVWDEDC